MPPRFAYWTIILDGAPTSFRTKEREEILPLYNQLKVKNPAALLKWFSGGRLWDSPEQAREARDIEKVRRFREERSQQMKTDRSPGSADPLAEFRLKHGRPADGSDQKPPAISSRPGPSPRPGSGQAGPGSSRSWSPGSSPRPGSGQAAPGSPKAQRRSKDWRPGGEHRDPRDKYKLPPGEARKRWKERNLKPGARKPPSKPWSPGSSPRPGPGQAAPGAPRGPKPFGSKPSGPKSFGDRSRGGRPFGQKPGGGKPFGGRPRGPKPFGGKPGGGRPGRPKPPGGPRRKG
jgi:23S rRNA pseudouridine2605 synthase